MAEFRRGSRGRYFGGPRGTEAIEFLLRIAIEIFQIGVRVTLGEMVVVGDPLVLDSALQLQPELDGAKRQPQLFFSSASVMIVST